MTTKTDITIHVGPQKLTDGSLVYNVYVGENNGSPVFHAYDEQNAFDFAEGLARLVEQHTCDIARVSHWQA